MGKRWERTAIRDLNYEERTKKEQRIIYTGNERHAANDKGCERDPALW